MSDTLLEGTTEGERLKLAGAGAWIAENARRLEALIDSQTRRCGKLKRVDIDMGRVERLDTFGAWLLERLVRAFDARGCDTKVTGLAAGLENLTGGPDGKSGELNEAARSIRTLADNLDKRTAEIGVGINRLTSTGTRTLNTIDRAAKNFDANPSRIIWGGGTPATDDKKKSRK